MEALAHVPDDARSRLACGRRADHRGALGAGDDVARLLPPGEGPGWALVGDAGHFKHPATAQGISDAIEQAIHVADALGGAEPAPNGYGEWRDRRASGHYEFSFQFGTFPEARDQRPIFDGISSQPETAQDLRDAMSRQVHPDRVFSKENLARWFEAAPVA